jgi:Ca2+-binding RTX toxin-like protein
MWIFGTNESETRWGTAEPDIIWGFGGDDTLVGGGGNDELYGGIGHDSLYGGLGNDRLVGEDGDDLLNGQEGADVMIGGVGNDTYVVDDINDKVIEQAGPGYQGHDTVRARIDYTLGANVEDLILEGAVVTGAGNALGNTIIGNDADNWLYGQGGNDSLKGGGGADHLFGGSDNDWLVGDAGSDWMEGGSGDDWYSVGESGDVVVELFGQGTDTVLSSITYTLTANVENLDFMWAAAAVDGTGNGLDNALSGNHLRNILNGLDGADRLYGQDGNDYLIGEAGRDELTGGDGSDDLVGGTEADTFIFWNVSDSAPGSRDHIFDFSTAERDRIDLSGIDANATGGTDNDAFSFIDGAAFSGTAGELRFDGDFIEADVNGDAMADLRIEINVSTMYATDFVL